MTRVVTVRLLSARPAQGQEQGVVEPCILASRQLNEELITQRFPDSLLGLALDARGEQSSSGHTLFVVDSKGEAGGCTLSVWGREPALFELAMDVYSRSGLQGVNLAPDGFTLEQAAEELAGYWQLPFTREQVLDAFEPSTAHHARLLAQLAAGEIWSQVQQDVKTALGDPTRAGKALAAGFIAYALDARTAAAGHSRTTLDRRPGCDADRPRGGLEHPHHQLRVLESLVPTGHQLDFANSAAGSVLVDVLPAPPER